MERSSMSVIAVRRTIRRKTPNERASFRDLTRRYFARERKWQFGIEALLFAIIATISAWPIFVAADALGEFLRRGPG
jgi:hypothetical protein